MAEAASVAQESLSMVQLVQSFGRGNHECERYDKTLEKFFNTSKEEIRHQALFISMVGFLSVFSTITIFWYGGSQVLAGRLLVGDVVAFLFYSQMISQTIGMLAEQYGAISRMTGASERVFELLDTVPAVRNSESPKTLGRSQGQMSLQNVAFAYGDGEPVLKDVSFDVEAGQTVALVGPSGAGKSSLLRLLSRLFDPKEGRVMIDGHDLRDLELDSVREQVAMVSQEVQLFAGSIRENIRYGRLDATDEEIREAAKLANADGFISELADGYDTEVGERGVKLSGGQRQRLSIARALLRDSPILILDEATSSVDSESEAAIQEALDRAERTTFVAAHRLSTILDADRILVLEEGQVVGFGHHDELMAEQGLYRRLVQKHFRGLEAVEAEARPAAPFHVVEAEVEREEVA